MNQYDIEIFNPNNQSESNLNWFVNNCRNLYTQNDNIKYLLHSGIMFTDEQSKEWLKDHDNNTKNYIIIKENNKMIALSIVHKNNMENYKLDSLVIDDSYLRKGISRRILNYIFEDVKDSGFKSIDTEVYADNIPMLTNVIKRGFKPIKIEYHKRFDGEDLIVLRKNILNEKT